MSFHWECPYCNSFTTIVNTYKEGEVSMTMDSSDGHKILKARFIVCPNPDCQKYVLEAWLHDYEYIEGRFQSGWKAVKLLKTWRLIPGSLAKVFPDYIPTSILQDYEEACAIKDLSPKAAATLARRCLQGMIRDFWGEARSRLIDEIDAIKDKVEPEVWDSIDAVRGVGNIGAHMEKDINVIVEVEPDEAQLLIELIEQLLEEWYVNRHEREERLKKITALSKAKNALKKAPQSAAPDEVQSPAA